MLSQRLRQRNVLFVVIVYHFDFSAYKTNFEEEIYNQIDEDGIGFNFKIGVNF